MDARPKIIDFVVSVKIAKRCCKRIDCISECEGRRLSQNNENDAVHVGWAQEQEHELELGFAAKRVTSLVFSGSNPCKNMTSETMYASNFNTTQRREGTHQVRLYYYPASKVVSDT